MQKITPFLWFDAQAEEAVSFYSSIFPEAKVLGVTRYGEGTPGKPGSVMTVKFALFGHEYIALNGGPGFRFTPAISLVVNCETQREIDHYWEKLSAGGSTQQCGWLQDKYGLSWQIVPLELGDMVTDGDDERSARVMRCLLQMEKLDLGRLRQAYEHG